MGRSGAGTSRSVKCYRSGHCVDIYHCELRMKIDLLLIIFFLIIAVTGAVTTVTGHRGGSVQIRCNYTSGYKANNKYLCRHGCSWDLKDLPVYSGIDSRDKRFTLYDNKSALAFIITITDLRAEDEGTYWCGIEKLGFDRYTKLKLLVEPEPAPMRTLSPTTASASTSTFGTSAPAESSPSTTANPGVPLYSLIFAGVTMVTAGVITVIYCKIKSRGRELTPRMTNHRNLYILQSGETPKLSEAVYQNLKQQHQEDQIYQNLF